MQVGADGRTRYQDCMRNGNTGAQDLLHPLLQQPALEPGATQVWQKTTKIGDLSRLRHEVVADIKNLVDEWTEHTTQWMQERPSHVKAVYSVDPDAVTQIPVLLHLLEQCGYPDMENINEDLSSGFDYVGPQHPGPGWLPRLDEAYTHPIKLETFEKLNEQYVHQKLTRGFVDQHWESMLQELVEEKQLDRVQGPFAAPSTWPCKTVAPLGHQLLPPPPGTVFPSVCFAVVQSDKIRRCEDLRRSFHNQTIFATQSPTHHNVDVYINAIRHLGQQGEELQLWSHDLDSAYRQFPLRDQRYAYTILATPSCPTLWRHGALAFGATSSVWSFNRAADCLMYVARKLLMAGVYHYVDDFAAVESTRLSRSSFESFTDLCECLSLKTKQKKAAPPSSQQVLLGVQFHIQPSGVTVMPCPERVTRIKQQVQSYLENDRLSSNEAQKLAGRLVFLQTTVFGQVGKAALQPIYARASDTNSDHKQADHLNTGLRRSLQNISKLLADIRPRWIPFSSSAEQSLIYTDAFFEMRDKRYKPYHADVPTNWNIKQAPDMNNGWGLVCKCQDSTYYAFGSVPAHVLQAYCHRKAYTYFLEAIAPLITLLLMKSRLASYVILFVDNQAALSALQKGYGKDEHINNMISVFWSLVSALNLFVHFSWVPSEHNVADKVSRHDTSEAEEQGWSLLQCDLEPIYRILVRAAKDSTFATFEASIQLLKRSPLHRPRA